MKLSHLTTSLLILTASVAVAQDEHAKLKSKKSKRNSREHEVVSAPKNRTPEMLSEGQLLRDADGKLVLVSQNQAGEKIMQEQPQFQFDNRFTYGCGIG